MSSEFLNWLSAQSQRITPEECAKLREASARLKELEDAPAIEVGETEFGEAILWFDAPELIGETVKIVRIPE